jgi:glycosyltransferase involved in cell wall biosynthesis
MLEQTIAAHDSATRVRNEAAQDPSCGTASPAPQLSVVIPCYNEHAVVRETYHRVKAVCIGTGLAHEIVLVNDGSSDGTWQILEDLSSSDPAVVAVSLSRNHGHQLALSAGLWACSGDRVLIMDADLQDPPELLPDMLKVMDDGADVVYAQRRSRPGDAPVKRAMCAIYYRLLKMVSDRPIPIDTGDFRLVSRRVCDLIVSMPERQRYIRGMVSWVGFRQEPILYDRDARAAGETKYPLRKLVALAINGIISSSVKPLAFAAVLGVLALLLGTLLTAYALVSWIANGDTPQGWTSLMVVVVFMGGTQLLMLGIIGEYIGRLFEQSRGRPAFMIDRIVRQRPSDGG